MHKAPLIVLFTLRIYFFYPRRKKKPSLQQHLENVLKTSYKHTMRERFVIFKTSQGS